MEKPDRRSLSSPKARLDHERKWDRQLQIRTCGRDEQNADEYRFPYEPTPYCVLERLAKSGLFGEADTLVDYGCGKGRVGFFMANQTPSRAIGIEYDQRMYVQALENQKTALSPARGTLFSGIKY